jgi:hypothetical protein
MDVYYAPWQYELREQLWGGEGETRTEFQRLILGSKRVGVPTPVTATVLGGVVFLAYAPLLQPGPPARLPSEGTFPIYNMGGFVV